MSNINIAVYGVKGGMSASWIFHFSSLFLPINISLTVSRHKNERGALAALQLARSSSQLDNTASYLFFSQTLAKKLRHKYVDSDREI